MGEASNDSFQDRINSWAKTHASERKVDPSAAQLPHQTTSLGTASQSGTQATGLTSEIKQHGSVGGKSASTNEKQNDSVISDLPSPPEVNAGDKDGDPPLEPVEEEHASITVRMTNGSYRFWNHTKAAICHSWINVLLVFVPVGIAINYSPISEDTKPTIVFALNAVAIIPLAGLLSHATESVASRMGDTLASLLNVTFGNAVELIIFIIALAKNEIRIVQASILGSILANLLLILGMAFLFGGLRYQEQIYNSTVTQMSACLLSLSVMSLLLPTAFHASFAEQSTADSTTVKISRGTSVVLLLVYVLYLLFQLKSHAYMYESTPQQIIDEESHPGLLADMLASSDDEASSSSSDTDTTTDSHTTAGRIKRAFRNRKNRHSSFSSNKDSSPHSEPSPIEQKQSGSAQPSPTNAYFDSQRQNLSGDEADTDGEANHGEQPIIRDFEAERGEASTSQQSKSPEPKPKKKSKKKRKHIRWHSSKDHKTTEQQDTLPPLNSEQQQTNNDTSENGQDIARTSVTKRPFMLKQLSTVALPKVLTNTVFSNPPPHNGTASQPLHPAGRSQNGLRRTNSLPDRLYRPRSTPQPHMTAQNTVDAAAGHGLAISDAHGTTEAAKDGDVPEMSRTAAVMLLLISTGLVAFCAELLVDNIPHMIQNSGVSQAFIGLIILPIVGNAAEHVTAVTVAAKNKMDLAIGVSVGSSIQIALFVTPFVVLLGWIMDKPMSLYFNLFETVSLFVTAFVVNFLVLDGRSNYLEGSLLSAAYVIIAVAAFFYPNGSQQSALGGGNGSQ